MKTIKNMEQRYPELVRKMCSAAILAGIKIMDVYHGNDFGVEFKADDSPITLADRYADQVIGEFLRLNFPDIPIISEESDCEHKSNRPKFYFLVDPLDGTKEFIKRTGEFTVNIGMILNERAELGVVYVPVTGELYYRDLDGLSYLEHDVKTPQLRSERSQILCKTPVMNSLTVVKSVSHSNADTEAYISLYAPTNSQSAGSSLKFGLIARGVADFYPRLGRTMEWDTGAAHAVLKGAGGNVRRLDTLEELSYGKLGQDNPFFVASGNDLPLISQKVE